MTGSWRTIARARRRIDGPRIGFVGLLGSGNLGNDASLAVVLDHVRRRHPDAAIDAMCMGPEQVTKEFGIDAVPIRWSKRYVRRQGGPGAVALRALGMGADAVRILRWVRRHDLVIVPGMGVFETSTPLRATGTPYSMFLLSASGRLTRTKVAFVCVGASVVRQRLTRWLILAAAHLASYRSYRDAASCEALHRQGLGTANDPVFTDLVFGAESPAPVAGDPATVGVGLMAFYGSTDDQRRGEELHRHYVEVMTSFVGWLLDSDVRVRLLWGDDVDDETVRRLQVAVEAHRPGLDKEALTCRPLRSLADVMEAITPLNAVVGTRYHTVLCALKLCKPTLSIGYSAKHDALMASAGMSAYSLSARELSLEQLMERFHALQTRASEIRRTLAEGNVVRARQIDQQLSDLSSLLCPSGASGRRTKPASGAVPSLQRGPVRADTSAAVLQNAGAG